MILITTSRKPSKRTRSLCREFNYSLPNSFYLTRGKKSIYEIVEIARSKGYFRIAIFKEKYGNPFKIDFITIDGENWFYEKDSLLISLIKLRREIIKEKIKFDSILFKGNEKIAYLFNVESELGSKFIFYVGKTIIKFIKNGKEIGPILKYRLVLWKK